jgi:hypothetical protein
MRTIQEEITGGSPKWDRAYVLRAMIEERYLMSHPGDPTALDKLVESYRNATNNGNTQVEVWQRFIDILRETDRASEAQEVSRTATLRGVMLNTQTGQLPQPFARMYSQIQEAIEKEDLRTADEIAQQCMKLASIKSVKSELIFVLNLTLGKVFLDASMFDSARRHLTEAAQRGGKDVYPLAICVAKSGDVDGGFSLLLDEIDLMPSAMQTLLPAVLVLLSQVQPSEQIYARIDRLMDRLERGERLTLKDKLEPSEKDHIISLGTKWVPTRKIQSLVFRFPEKTENLDPSALLFFSPSDFEEEEPADKPNESVQQP